MKSTPKWLMIPPVVAVLLILGPLSMQGGGEAQPEAATPPASRPADQQDRKAGGALPGSLVPKTPDMWKIGSTLVGVLLLGGAAVFLMRRLRGGAAPNGASQLATLRQTVRLSQRQSLHAIEFDDRILLVGESDKGLTLIERGRLPNALSDEQEVLARHVDATVDDEEDEGATPKNLLIPRPDRPAKAPQPKRASPQKVAAAAAQLNDFRNLLMKAGR